MHEFTKLQVVLWVMETSNDKCITILHWNIMIQIKIVLSQVGINSEEVYIPCHENNAHKIGFYCVYFDLQAHRSMHA